MSTTRLCDICLRSITGTVRYSAGRIDDHPEKGEVRDRLDWYDICPNCWDAFAKEHLT